MKAAEIRQRFARSEMPGDKREQLTLVVLGEIAAQLAEANALKKIEMRLMLEGPKIEILEELGAMEW